MSIRAIPTEFLGVRFRSKSEAMFAAALEGPGDCKNWMYEPPSLAVEGWLVDFAIPVVSPSHDSWHLQVIEYKPKRPAGAYLGELAERFRKMASNAPQIDPWCVWVDWFAMKEGRFDWGAMHLIGGTWKLERGRFVSPTIQAMPPFEAAYPRGFQEIASMRFDIYPDSGPQFCSSCKSWAEIRNKGSFDKCMNCGSRFS